VEGRAFSPVLDGLALTWIGCRKSAALKILSWR
jgi:hypothetical protein